MRYKITELHEFLEQLPFSGQAAFHIYGRVNRQSCRIREGRKLKKSGNMKEAPPKLNFWRARSKLCIIDICFLTKRQATVNVTVQRCKISSSLTSGSYIFFRHDSASCHYALNVRRFFNDAFTGK
jgi:hypothetical protein